MLRDIGSIYPIEGVVPFGVGSPRAGFRTEKHLRFVSLCREALSLIARRHAAEGNRRVLLPAYTCHTVNDPFLLNGYHCGYYGVRTDLRIDVESLDVQCSVLDPDIIVVHPFHGMDLDEAELAALSSLKRPGRIFVMDLTQCVFSTAKSPLFDYYVGSLRKWMPMPDGAFIASDWHELDSLDSFLPENEAYVDTELAAMRLRGEYFASGDVRIKNVSRGVDKAAQSFVTHSVDPHEMCAYSKFVTSVADFDEIARRRMENYRYLFDNLKAPGILPLCDGLSRVTCAPLYFPVLVSDRVSLVQKLIDERIYAPVLWPIPGEEVLINEMVQTLYNSFLAIPIDQRCGVDEMKRICEVVRS